LLQRIVAHIVTTMSLVASWYRYVLCICSTFHHRHFITHFTLLKCSLLLNYMFRPKRSSSGGTVA
jgi:hypothetical protein